MFGPIVSSVRCKVHCPGFVDDCICFIRTSHTRYDTEALFETSYKVISISAAATITLANKRASGHNLFASLPKDVVKMIAKLPVNESESVGLLRCCSSWDDAQLGHADLVANLRYNSEHDKLKRNIRAMSFINWDIGQK